MRCFSEVSRLYELRRPSDIRNPPLQNAHIHSLGILLAQLPHSIAPVSYLEIVVASADSSALADPGHLAGANIETHLEDGATALLVTSYHPCPAIVSNLIAHGASVHARRSDGVTSLIMSSNKGHLRNVELLLAAKADPNVAMRDGTTALHTATYKGHTQVVAALIAGKSDVQARCYDGVTALLMAAKSGLAGRDELVRLRCCRAIVRPQRTREPLPHNTSPPPQVRMLLEANADVDAPLRDGGTPLLAASYKGHTTVVRALLEHRATVDASRSDGLTALCQVRGWAISRSGNGRSC